MAIMQEVSISKNSGDVLEYVIRDKDKINIGRFVVLEIDKENKKCSVKFKFYRREHKQLLRDTLMIMLKAFYKDISINKVNIFVVETIELSAFLDLGFTLEGILSNNIYNQGIYYNELSMGINREEYYSATRVDNIVLKSNKLLIRNLNLEDNKELLDYYVRNKKHFEKYEPKRDIQFYTEEVQKNILIDSYRQFMNGASIDFGIFIDDKLIGKIKLSNIVYGIFKNGILGYSIDENYQGKGLMKEAVKMVLQYAFNEVELHRIEASALVDNERSKGVLLECGFKELGINKQYLFINGKWQDHITFYITRPNEYNKEVGI